MGSPVPGPDSRPDKRETCEVFRARLAEVIAGSGLTRSAFAAAAGLDRSSLSQMLHSDATRLPRAETVAAMARVAGVSVDWLLGLSQEGQVAADVMNLAVEIAPGVQQPVDTRLARWHREVIGYKIRYVPATLPDLLKTDALIRFEYQGHRMLRAEGRIEQAEQRLRYTRRPDSDMEVCSAIQTVQALARGEGIWRELSSRERRDQLNHMADLLDELYPTLRWFLFDARTHTSVPLTIFGPKRAALFLGDMYLVLNATEHVRVLTRHFDDLIRAAVMQPPELIDYLRRLAGA